MANETEYGMNGELLPGYTRAEIAQFGQGFGTGAIVAGVFDQVNRAIEQGLGSFVDGFIQAVGSVDLEMLASALETARARS